MQRIFIKKCFLFAVGNVCLVKRFTAGSRDVALVTLMTKRLKRRCGSGWDNSQRLLCSGFRRTGKAMGQVCQCWWRICREANVFSRFEYHMFYVLYQFGTYLLTLPRNMDVTGSTNGEMRNVYKIVILNYDGKGCFIESWLWRKHWNDTHMRLREIRWRGVDFRTVGSSGWSLLTGSWRFGLHNS
jgi:hypothetical protein